MAAAAGKQSEAARYLSFAETLLGRGDLVGSKRFADNALESDPLLPGVDQILAVADVLLASQHHHVNNQPNWYSLLQLDPSSAPDLTAVKRHYRRLALLLHPDSNKSPGAADAFKLVVDAFAILSDPTKKSLFDAELNINIAVAAAPRAAAAGPFWTTCPSCLHVHQYPRHCQNRLLRCPTCHRPFRATEAAAPPPLVPNTSMYHASWGFFPLGYAGSGAPASANLPDHTVFHPLPSWWNPHQPAPADPAPQPNARKETAAAVTPTPTPAKSTKKTARKSIRNNAGKQPAPAPTEPVPISTAPPPPKFVPEPIAPVPLAWEAPAGTNPTTEQGGAGGAKANDTTPMEADPESSAKANCTPMEADAPTGELPGNLQNTPILKDGEIQNETPTK